MEGGPGGGGAGTGTAEHPDDIHEPTPGEGVPTPEASADSDPLRVVLASMDQNVDAFAREAAHEKMAKKHEGPFWKRMAKSVWQNLTREYQIVKATEQARDEIHENENLLHHHGKSDEKWREAVVNRYGSEYAEHLVHEGESLRILNAAEAAKDPKAERIFNDIQELMRKVARGEVADDASLDMMEARMAESWKEDEISQEFIGEGRLLAKNIGAKARQLEAMVNSAEGLSDVERAALLEEHLSKLEIATGEARVGSRTEIDSTLSERLGEKLRRVPFISEGRIAAVSSAVGNETMVAAMVSGALLVGKRAFSTAGRIIGPGLAAGVIAGVRERRALKDERNLMQRRADAGQEVDPTNKAQAELDNAMYETRPASELISELGDLYNEDGELNISNREELDRAIELQAQIRARIQISDRTGARLIGFDNMEDMEAQRFDLDLAMAKLSTDMGKMFNNPIAVGMLDITPEESFDKLFEEQKSIAIGMLEGEMKTQDRVFNKLMAKRVLKRALTAMFMGAAIGYAAKEAAEFAGHAYDKVKEWISEFGSTEGMPDVELAGYQTDGDVPSGVGENGEAPTGVGSEVPTGVGEDGLPISVGADGRPAGVGNTGAPTGVGTDATGVPKGVGVDDVPSGVGVGPEGLPTSVGVDASGDVLPGSVGAPETVDFGDADPLTDTSKITLPEGFKTEVEGNSVTITTPDGKEITGLTLEKDGQLSEDSLKKLQANGYSIAHNQGMIPGEPKITRTEVTPTEFVKQNSSQMKNIHITEWFRNNTSRYDLNELGLQNKMDANGNIIISIKGMTAGGSFNGASGVNWEEAAKDGHMKVYLSASEGSQAKAFEVQFKPDGTAVIEQGSDARALFDKDGTFIGGFQQAALNGGKGPDGSENIAVLATVVGEKSPTLTSTTETPTWDTVHHYTVFQTEPAAATTTLPPPISFVPPTPVFTTRRNLGEAEDRPDATPAAAPGDTDSTGPESPDGEPDADTTSAPGDTGAPDADTEAGSTDGGSPEDTDADTDDAEADTDGAEAPAPDGSETDEDEASTASTEDGEAETGGPEAGTEDGSEDDTTTSADDTSTPDGADSPDDGADTNAETEEEETPEAEPAPEAEPETPEADTAEEANRLFMEGLDGETLSFPSGYDFPGMPRTFNERERKLAARYIRQAEGGLGGNDKPAVVALAAQLMANDASTATGQVAALYASTSNLLQRSAEQTKRQAERDNNAGEGATFLDDLDSESEAFPFGLSLNANNYSPRVQKLITRIYREARTQIVSERGPLPDQYADAAGYKKHMKAVFRRAQRMTHPDQYDGLGEDQKKLFEEAVKAFSAAQPFYTR
jgi:hypothetical protein